MGVSQAIPTTTHSKVGNNLNVSVLTTSQSKLGRTPACELHTTQSVQLYVCVCALNLASCLYELVCFSSSTDCSSVAEHVVQCAKVRLKRRQKPRPNMIIPVPPHPASEVEEDISVPGVLTAKETNGHLLLRENHNMPHRAKVLYGSAWKTQSKHSNEKREEVSCSE